MGPGPDRAEMSSISSAVGELARRIEVMLEQASRDGLDTLAAELAVVERSLLAAHRKLESCVGR